AERRQRAHHPERGVRVLAAILAHAGHVALDVARVVRGAVEGRREQADEPRALVHQLALDGVDRLRGALGRRHAGEDRPGLRERVDPALVARRRAERRAVVVVGAPVPRAVPAGLLERRRERRTVLAVAPRTRAVPAALAERDEAAEHVVEEEAEPDALAAALPPDAVHAVVPIPPTPST